jgi:hypothetical protein
MESKSGRLQGVVGLLISAFLCTDAISNELESWYTYWGLGYANTEYPDDLQPIIDDLQDLPDIEHLSSSLDTFGFYWPISEKVLLGGVVNGMSDYYEDSVNEFSIIGYLFSFSGMQFMQGKIGQGPFIRGDIGIGQLEVDDGKTIAESDYGSGFLVGGGFAVPITNGTRILFNGNYAVRRVGGQTYETFALSVGGLF